MLKNKLIIITFFLFCFLGLSLFSSAQEQSIYKAKGKRDPFTPLVTSDGRLLKLDTEEKQKILRLEGIIYDDNGMSYAIVNGSVVKVGDPIGGFQVLKIRKNLVAFIKDGQVSEIEIKKEDQ